MHSILCQGDIRAAYTRVNNQYVATPKLFIHQYDFSVEQRLDDFLSEVTMRGGSFGLVCRIYVLPESGADRTFR